MIVLFTYVAIALFKLLRENFDLKMYLYVEFFNITILETFRKSHYTRRPPAICSLNINLIMGGAAS